MQEHTPPYDDILEDETLAPLKRNHACLQCKKRKVKCDAVRPTCNPCMRSHAHALRSAQRNKSRPPPLVCTYAEGDDEELPPGPTRDAVLDTERKRSSAAPAVGKRAAVGDKLQREKERRAAEDKDTLRARIAELEARLASLTTEPQTQNRPHAHISPVSMSSGSGSSPENNNQATVNGNYLNNANSTWDIPLTGIQVPPPQFDTTPSTRPPMVSIEAGAPGQFQSFDFSNFLMLPAKWPKNLPAPAVLEHLIDTFFQFEPQVHRIIHRPTLLQRLGLPPTHPDFPFPGLLHAICSAAAPHTAWINTLKPEELEEMSTRHITLGLDLEQCEDFSVAQAEAAERCIRHSTTICMMGSGTFVFDMARAQLILSHVYFNKGMALRSWMSASSTRLIKALEIVNRNVRKSDKPALMGEPKSDQEREERLATVWLAYLQEAGFAINSNWAPTFDIDEIHIALPTSTDEFLQKYDTSGYMKANPQTGHDDDVLVNHPIPDPFVLVIKCSILLGKVAKWVREWQQREIKPGDTMAGFRSPAFVKLNAEIAAFQLSIPSTLKNIYKMADSGATGSFNADLLSIHLYPNLASLLLHEQFVDWKGPETPSHRHMQKAFEAVVGFIHLVPSQLDVSLLLDPLLAFSLFTVGKNVSRFIVRATQMEQYALANRWRTDLTAITSLLQRYGSKHALGLHLTVWLRNHERLYETGQLDDDCAKHFRITHASACSSEAPDMVDCSLRSASTNGSGRSPAMPSMGHSPESVEAVEGQTSVKQNGMMPSADSLFPPMNGVSLESLSLPGSGMSTNAPTNAATPGFDPSLLEFIDPAVAAQLMAAMEANPAAMNAGMGTGMGTGMTPLGMGMDDLMGAGANGRREWEFSSTSMS